MFEICARLGTRDDSLRTYGQLLGTLYHGCDDVADVRGTTALGGGSEKDIVDGILTLPGRGRDAQPGHGAPLPQRRPGHVRPDRPGAARGACRRRRPTSTASQRRPRARRRGNAAHPERLLDLLRHTRALSAA